MGRLVLLLAALIGWGIYTRRPSPPAQLFGSKADAFPFPTSAAHDGIALDDAAAVAEWCERFGCTEEQLRAAVRATGTGPEAVRAHLQRPR